jgi:DNA-binding Xre family transcriptional regulator
MEIETVRVLKDSGYDLPTLKTLSMRTKSYGGVKALLENLDRRIGPSELDKQIGLKKKELDNLNPEASKKRIELRGLDETLESRKRVKEYLEKSISTSSENLKALNKAERALIGET